MEGLVYKELCTCGTKYDLAESQPWPTHITKATIRANAKHVQSLLPRINLAGVGQEKGPILNTKKGNQLSDGNQLPEPGSYFLLIVRFNKAGNLFVPWHFGLVLVTSFFRKARCIEL